jgi:hypothetical protein
MTVPDSLLGQSVRCPECGCLFQTTAEGKAIKPEPREPVADSPAPVPTITPLPNTIACLACHESIPADALRCPFCDEDPRRADRLDDAPNRFIRRDVVPHRGNIILLLGILSLVGIGLGVCCPLLTAFGVGVGAGAWMMGNTDLRRIANGEMDPGGEGSTNAGRICGIIGVILNGLYLLAIGAYVLAMLIMVWLGQA